MRLSSLSRTTGTALLFLVSAVAPSTAQPVVRSAAAAPLRPPALAAEAAIVSPWLPPSVGGGLLEALGQLASPGLRPAVCFAPGTKPEVVAYYTQVFGRGPDPLFQFQDGARWTSTATQGCCLGQGAPTTLTWSIVPDGTTYPVGSGVGEPLAASNLKAFLNGIYGGQATWQAVFQQVFDRWGALTGITYVYESHDDGAVMFNSPGVLGVRGDLRLSGHFIDGAFGILAYNYYPNNGDMVLDTGDTYFNNTTSSSLNLRNVAAHEHGHGLGFDHSCPLIHTKLMEPFASSLFDGPQHDDILAANRGYGDDREPDDTTGTAANLGALGNGTLTVDDLSVDDAADLDYYRLTVAANKKATVTVTPVGFTYLAGPQNPPPSGTCSAGSSFNSLILNDVSLQLLDTNGTSVLATANGNPAGVAETVANVPLTTGAGTYFIKVTPGANHVAQLYRLAVTIADQGPVTDLIFQDGFESGNLSSWTASSTDGGDLTAGSTAPLAGSFSLRATIDDTNTIYVEDDSPSLEDRYRVRFDLDPNGYSTGADGQRTKIFQAFDQLAGNRRVITVVLRKLAGQYKVLAKAHLDDGTWGSTGFFDISDAPHAIELDWLRSSSPVANNGSLQMWIDGTSRATVTGLGNNLSPVDFARLGAFGIKPGAAGTLVFDDFVSHRVTYIGP